MHKSKLKFSHNDICIFFIKRVRERGGGERGAGGRERNQREEGKEMS